MILLVVHVISSTVVIIEMCMVSVTNPRQGQRRAQNQSLRSRYNYSPQVQAVGADAIAAAFESVDAGVLRS